MFADRHYWWNQSGRQTFLWRDCQGFPYNRFKPCAQIFLPYSLNKSTNTQMVKDAHSTERLKQQYPLLTRQISCVRNPSTVKQSSSSHAKADLWFANIHVHGRVQMAFCLCHRKTPPGLLLRKFKGQRVHAVQPPPGPGSSSDITGLAVAPDGPRCWLWNLGITFINRAPPAPTPRQSFSV